MPSASAEEITKKYGLEVGLWKASAITLSLKSLGLCYALISAGVDVSSLLWKGFQATKPGKKVGIFALAYAAHKAASPIRFPPIVALTPSVASWTGKKVDKEN